MSPNSIIGDSRSTAAVPPEVDTPSAFSVPVKRCCGVLTGDECDCASFNAEARGVFARPIFWDLRTRKDAA